MSSIASKIQKYTRPRIGTVSELFLPVSFELKPFRLSFILLKLRERFFLFFSYALLHILLRAC